METANQKVARLFKQWRAMKGKHPDEYYKDIEPFKRECEKMANAEVIKDLNRRNIIRLITICSAVRFIDPWRLLLAFSIYYDMQYED